MIAFFGPKANSERVPGTYPLDAQGCGNQLRSPLKSALVAGNCCTQSPVCPLVLASKATSHYRRQNAKR
jgi:hypothetical protein